MRTLGDTLKVILCIARQIFVDDGPIIVNSSALISLLMTRRGFDGSL